MLNGNYDFRFQELKQAQKDVSPNVYKTITKAEKNFNDRIFYDWLVKKEVQYLVQERKELKIAKRKHKKSLKNINKVSLKNKTNKNKCKSFN